MKRFALILLLAACSPRNEGLPYYTDAQLSPRWLADDEIDDAHRIADFVLLNQQGDTVRARTVAGKIYVANFFFTQCQQICPRLKSSLARVQEAYREDDTVLLLSHSVTPETDHADVLARYARANAIEAGKWHLLTGDRAQINDLARRSYFVELSDNTGNTEGTLVHTEVLVLVDQEGHIRGVYDGTLPFDVDQLIADIGILTRSRE